MSVGIVRVGILDTQAYHCDAIMRGMITVLASTIFLLAFVALGARPWRVTPPLPPSEEVPAMPATVYMAQTARDLLTQDSVSFSGNRVRNVATRDEADSYFALALKRDEQERRDRISQAQELIARQRQKIAGLS